MLLKSDLDVQQTHLCSLATDTLIDYSETDIVINNNFTSYIFKKLTYTIINWLAVSYDMSDQLI